MQYMHGLCYITELQRVKLFFKTLLENIIFLEQKDTYITRITSWYMCLYVPN